MVDASRRSGGSSRPLIGRRPAAPATLHTPAFDRLARLAAALLKSSTVLIWLVEGDRLLRKGPRRTSWAEAGRGRFDRGLCRRIFRAGAPSIIDAARLDPRPAGGPPGPGPTRVACVGVPLVDGRGRRLGVLCTVDGPRGSRDGCRLAVLVDLAESATKEIDLLSLEERLARAEKALLLSEQCYRLQSENATDMISRFDALGVFLDVTPACRHLLGYSPEELIGRPIYELIHPDDLAAVARSGEALRASPGAQLQSCRLRHKDGRYLWIEGSTQAILDPDTGAFLEVRCSSRDVTERVRAEEKLAHQASHDALTGLPNRTLLRDELERHIGLPGEGMSPFSLLLLDLDRFKEINDTFGHHCGDAVLERFSLRLAEVVRGSDVLARLGGDEFGILLPGADERRAREAAAGIQGVLARPIVVEGRPFDVRASIGIAIHPEHGLDAETLLKHADVAMYSAKRAGAGSSVYSSGRDHHCPRRLGLVVELRRAIDDGQLRLHYQPTFDLGTMRPVGMEALVRWQHPRDGLLGPGEFIPMAEQTGLIRPLGLWALREALHQRRAWSLGGIDLGVSVNLSPENLQDDLLVGTIDRLMDEAEVPPRRLTVEVTEGAMMADPARAKSTLARLHRAGVLVSIDDFGTGYSSLGYLKELPVDEVKVDRSFVRDMAANERDACIVRSVIELGHNLGHRVVAEGVESRETLDLLTSWGCDLAQGFLLGRPLPACEVPAWLARTGGAPPMRSG
ncbi:putative bifunctional diguanylate cyclase/phosphodiesterase [Paludisphaera mucosa]|uniref:EAL domain-containing protein n=1 Tax=Paludisphaera mucosa TaxID=3030827 RepID=A0ABT6FD07_9BACT|nr:EAL domain-containing protein [Paludisphaera mucosa]MDG3005467.1 EAL domain-containing protein [Paludisphaera mucosa]